MDRVHLGNGGYSTLSRYWRLLCSPTTLAVNPERTYNLAMALLLLTILAYSTQNEALFAGSVPEKVPTFCVTVRGSDPFYAGIRLNGKWVDDPGMEMPQRQEVELVPDLPWPSQETYRVLSSKIEIKYETTAMRRDRLQKALAAQGYALRETANGWWPVRDTDAQYAERQRKMLELARQTAATAVPALPEEGVAVQDAATPGGAGRPYAFGMLALPVVCLAAIVFVGKKLVFAGADNR